MISTDLIIIGAGPGGYETAAKAAKEGLRVVIIEASQPGGTCLNEGCIPTKCFCRNAEVLHDLKEAETFGLKVPVCGVDMATVVERKNHVVETLRQGVLSIMKNPLITYVQGKAVLVDAHTVHVEQTEGETDYTGENILIAVGSVTKFLPVPGAHLPKVLTSTEMLNLKEVPQRLCIVGGGVIGMEFASIFNAFGSEVTVLEYCKEILPNLDSDMAKRLRMAMKAQGIQIFPGAQVTAIRETDAGYATSYLMKDKEEQVEADIVLMAVGRVANVSALNLETVGIAYDKQGIVTDKDFRTNIPNIFAIGDINGKCQLAHAASFQGKHVINLIKGKEDKIRFDIIPSAVFTVPEMASVGFSSDYCKANGIMVVVHKAFFRANGKALAMNEADGILKLLTDEQGYILGCHILGAHAADLIEEIAILMNTHSSIKDLADVIHAHPTLSEVVLSAAEN